MEEKVEKREKEKSNLIESLPRTTWRRKLKPTIQVNCEPKLDRAQDRLSPKIQLWVRTDMIFLYLFIC